MEKKNKLFKKADLLLLLCILLASSLLLTLSLLPREKGKVAIVKCDGEEIGRYSLHEKFEIPIKTNSGENLLIIDDGTAYIKDANCPDKLCVHQGAISDIGDSIICLPHRVSITVTE